MTSIVRALVVMTALPAFALSAAEAQESAPDGGEAATGLEELCAMHRSTAAFSADVSASRTQLEALADAERTALQAANADYDACQSDPDCTAGDLEALADAAAAASANIERLETLAADLAAEEAELTQASERIRALLPDGACPQ